GDYYWPQKSPPTWQGILSDSLISFAMSAEGVSQGPLWTIHIEFVGSLFIYLIAFVLLGLKASRSRWLLHAIILYASYVFENYLFLFTSGLLIADLEAHGVFRTMLRKRPRITSLLATGCAALLFHQFYVFATQKNLFPDYEYTVLDSPGPFRPPPEYFVPALLGLLALELSPAAQRLFASPPLRVLGKLSFSMYLLHGPLVSALYQRLLAWTFAAGWAWLTAVVASLAAYFGVLLTASWLGYLFLDVTAIRAANMLADSLVYGFATATGAPASSATSAAADVAVASSRTERISLVLSVAEAINTLLDSPGFCKRTAARLAAARIRFCCCWARRGHVWHKDSVGRNGGDDPGHLAAADSCELPLLGRDNGGGAPATTVDQSES
ncbi:hypothetical protein HK405_015421, partial [Cladochytrium tenue]